MSEILPAWAPLAARPAVVFVGGPVALNGVICLARSTEPGRDGDLGAAWRPLLGGLGTVDLETDPDDPSAN